MKSNCNKGGISQFYFTKGEKMVQCFGKNISYYKMIGHILIIKDQKSKNNSFYQHVFVNTLFGNVADKEFLCKFKLSG